MTEDRRDITFEAAERFQRERDEARARIEELESDVNARVIALEAAKNAAEARAAKFASVCQNIVNNPKLPREQVQSQLLLVIQQTGG